MILNLITLGGETFAGRKFCDFSVFWHFSRKFLPRHNAKAKSWLGPLTEPLVSSALKNLTL